jgi:hypothetical protein
MESMTARMVAPRLDFVTVPDADQVVQLDDSQVVHLNHFRFDQAVPYKIVNLSIWTI